MFCGVREKVELSTKGCMTVDQITSLGIFENVSSIENFGQGKFTGFKEKIRNVGWILVRILWRIYKK